MSVDAGIGLARLAHRVAEGAVVLDAMHGHVARIIIGGEEIFARFVDAGMDGTRRQRLRLAVRLQGARRGIDAECAGEMLVTRGTRPAVARHDIEISLRRMRPGILDVGRKRHRAALLQRGVGNVDVEQRQLRADAGVEDGLSCHWLTPRTLGGCDRAGKERGKCAAIDHGGFPPMSFSLLWRRS